MQIHSDSNQGSAKDSNSVVPGTCNSPAAVTGELRKSLCGKPTQQDCSLILGDASASAKGAHSHGSILSQTAEENCPLTSPSTHHSTGGISGTEPRKMGCSHTAQETESHDQGCTVVRGSTAVHDCSQSLYGAVSEPKAGMAGSLPQWADAHDNGHNHLLAASKNNTGQPVGPASVEPTTQGASTCTSHGKDVEEDECAYCRICYSADTHQSALVSPCACR